MPKRWRRRSDRDPQRHICRRCSDLHRDVSFTRHDNLTRHTQRVHGTESSASMPEVSEPAGIDMLAPDQDTGPSSSLPSSSSSFQRSQNLWQNRFLPRNTGVHLPSPSDTAANASVPTGVGILDTEVPEVSEGDEDIVALAEDLQRLARLSALHAPFNPLSPIEAEAEADEEVPLPSHSYQRHLGATPFDEISPGCDMRGIEALVMLTEFAVSTGPSRPVFDSLCLLMHSIASRRSDQADPNLPRDYIEFCEVLSQYIPLPQRAMYCPECLCLFSIGACPTPCTACGSSSARPNRDFFYWFGACNTVRTLLQGEEGLFDAICDYGWNADRWSDETFDSCAELRDCWDGEALRELRKQGLVGRKGTVTLFLNTDGVETYRSHTGQKVHTFSAWPLLAEFADLPPQSRSQIGHVFPIALWPAHSKVIHEVLWTALWEDIRLTFECLPVGQAKPLEIKIQPVRLHADDPATSAVCGFPYASGYFAGPRESNQGERIVHPTNPRVGSVYFGASKPIMRTKDDFIRLIHAAESIKRSAPDRKVADRLLEADRKLPRGQSATEGCGGLPRYDKFDVNNPVYWHPIDRLHSIEGGAVEKLLDMW